MNNTELIDKPVGYVFAGHGLDYVGCVISGTAHPEYVPVYATPQQAQPEREVTRVLKQAYDAMVPMRGLMLFDQAMAEISKTLAALGLNQVEVLDFCDKNCTWSDHHSDCKNGEAQPERAPLSLETILEIVKAIDEKPGMSHIDVIVEMTRAIEAAHGIKQGGQHE